MSSRLLTIGVNYRTAPIEIRERLAFSPAKLRETLTDLLRIPPVGEGVILSTCNRTEVYCTFYDSDPTPLIEWLASFGGLDREVLLPHLDLRRGPETIRHLFRVACGLDSMVLGEPQILGQVKQAYRLASEVGATGKILERLFQHAFRAAKKIRRQTALGESPISVAYAAVRLAQQLFADFKSKTALLIGAGEMVELTAHHLKERQIGRLLIANRTLSRALKLAEPLGGEALLLEELPERLHEADLVVSSTASPLPILGKGAVEAAIKKRRHRPIFMVDLAVPRDIEPEVGALEDVYLYTVDDLEAIVAENRKLREKAAREADLLIEHEVAQFLNWLKLQGATGTLCALRQRGEILKQKALRRAMRALRGGKAPEEALELLAHALTNGWLHMPSITLREAAQNERHDLIAAARELFRLDEEGDDEGIHSETAGEGSRPLRRSDRPAESTGSSAGSGALPCAEQGVRSD